MMYIPPKDIDSRRWFKLHVIVLIDTILCSDKKHECFHTGLILIVQGICIYEERYVWAPCILAMLYRDLHSFILVLRGDQSLAH